MSASLFSLFLAASAFCIPCAASKSTLSDCLAQKNVPITLISSPEFKAQANTFNLRSQYTPALFVVPTTVQHISDALKCAANAKSKVQAKSGGHSFANFGTGGQNGSVIIDLQSFQDITVDKASNYQAKVGSGVRLGNLALALFNQSGRALPHGTCPGVGIGGHATHGGYGYDSRAWGLTLDQIEGLDVVLANGSFVHSSEAENNDLFYALRGAADSFGIVTAFYMKTQAAPKTVINFSYSFPGLFNHGSVVASEMFLHLQDFARNESVVDRNLSFGVYVDAYTFTLQGTYFGPEARYNAIIALELLRTLPKANSSSLQTVDWIKSLTILAGQPLSQPLGTGYDEHDSFFAKSLVVPETAPLTPVAVKSYFEYLATNGLAIKDGWYSIVNLYGGPDSQINTVDPSAAAYPDRKALWVFQHYGHANNFNQPFPQDLFSFVAGMNDAISKAQPDTKFGAYLNYVDPSLSTKEAHELYYGKDVYDKLVAIKREVDSEELFWNPQAVGT